MGGPALEEDGSAAESKGNGADFVCAVQAQVVPCRAFVLREGMTAQVHFAGVAHLSLWTNGFGVLVGRMAKNHQRECMVRRRFASEK
jgi:hypothetical protein